MLDSAAAGGQTAEALHLLAEIRGYGRGMWESVPLYERALEHVGDDDGRRAAIELDLAFQVEQMGEFDAALEHGRRAASLAEGFGDPGLLAEALAVVEVAGFMAGHGTNPERIARALSLEDVNRELRIEMRPSLIAAFLALYQGELQRSVELLTAIRDRVLERGQESDLPFVLGYVGWAECWRGNLSVATAMGEESVVTSTRLGLASLECFSQAMTAWFAACAGDEAAVRAGWARTHQLAEETGIRIATIWSDWAVAILALSMDEASEAAAALAPITAIVEEQGLPEPVRVPSIPESIESLISIGQLDRAGRLLEILVESATRLNRSWALAAASRCRALLLAAQGNLDAAAAAANEAVERGERLELRFDLARSFLVAGQIERRRRRKRDAARRLASALTDLRRCGREALGGAHPARARPHRPSTKRTRADRDRASGRRACRCRPHQQGGCIGALHQPEDRRGQPLPRLQQARDPLPSGAGRQAGQYQARLQRGAFAPPERVR